MAALIWANTDFWNARNVGTHALRPQLSDLRRGHSSALSLDESSTVGMSSDQRRVATEWLSTTDGGWSAVSAAIR